MMCVIQVCKKCDSTSSSRVTWTDYHGIMIDRNDFYVILSFSYHSPVRHRIWGREDAISVIGASPAHPNVVIRKKRKKTLQIVAEAIGKNSHQ